MDRLHDIVFVERDFNSDRSENRDLRSKSQLQAITSARNFLGSLVVYLVASH
jgi:hypothetical protein